MNKLKLIGLISVLSVLLMGCYHGKTSNWEGVYIEDTGDKKADETKFYFEYLKKQKVTFDEIEMTANNQTIFNKKNYKNRDISVTPKCGKKCDFNKEKTLKVHITWKIDDKKYEETVTLTKQ